MTITHSERGLHGVQPDLVVSLDHHFLEFKSAVYTDLAFGYDYWREYLEVFPSVKVFARVSQADDVPDSFFRADGPGVTFLAAPDFTGPKAFVTALPWLLLRAWKVSARSASFLLRNGTLSTALWLCLEIRRSPFSREVQGDQLESVLNYDGATRGYARHLLVPLARLADGLARVQAHRARAVSYVSEATRRRYPSRSPGRGFVFSSVRLDASSITGPRPAEFFEDEERRILSIGRVEREKGHHVLLTALALLMELRPSRSWKLTVMGPGSRIETLRNRAAELGLAGNVEFIGPRAHGPEFHSVIDKAHLFVLPSLTEGLPRALMEVMARGLPAVAASVGGVPSLLDEDQLCETNDPQALCALLDASLWDPQRLARMSASGFDHSTTNYSADLMRSRKRAFWNAIAKDIHA